MARLNKFASVNLNESYGKPDRGGSANNNNSSSSSSSGKPRISSPGGMLVLSRPGRTQPPSPKPGQARLGIPSPVNLPSLKRESSAADPLPASSPPHAGWTKGESPPLSGWTKPESPIDTSHLQQKAGLSRSLDMVGDNLKAIATGKPDVYAPPALRAMQTGSTPRPLPPTPPIEKPSAVIRGEEFPTLQAAVARPPTPPQHPRQRDLQQKQREKHQEAKEQQLKLQQLSQAQGQNQSPSDSSQVCSGNANSQPSLSLRPLGKQEIVSQKVNGEVTGSHPLPHSSPANNRFGMQGPNAFVDGSLSRSPPAGVQNQGSASKASNVFVDGSLSRSPPAGMPNPSSVNKADDLRDAGHNFRPQYRSPLPVSHGSPSVDIRQSGFQNGSEPSWLSSSRRDFAPPSRNGDYTKLAGDMRTSTIEDTGRISSEPRSASFGRESYFTKDASFFREGSSGGFGREDANVQSEGFGRESSDSRFNTRSSALVHDGVPRIEGFYSQRSFGREAYNREPREVNNRMIREPGSRENMDAYHKDIRESRENFSRDTGDVYDRDVREAYNRDSRNVYTRDVREVHNQDVPMNKQVGYGYSSNNNGDNTWRGNSSYIDSPYGRGVVHSPGIAPAYNPGSGHDTHYGRRSGPQGFGDQFFTREARPGPDPRSSRGLHVEPAAPYGPAETLGSRRVRSPAPSNSSFDPVKEVHEVRFEKSQRSFDEDRQIKFEDKGVDAKVTGNEPYGSSFCAQKPCLKRELSQGSATRIVQINTNKNLDDERSSREDLKKQLMLEDERRKEAAKLKLLELEERIARRAVEEGRKDEGESVSKDHVKGALKQQDVEQVSGNFRFEPEGMGPVPERDIDVSWGEEDSGSKLAQPFSASSTSSWNYKPPGEGLVSQEQDFRLVSESELNQDRKVVRSRSPSSWRKEIGGGPTSKLFSSPYVEGGGFRRPSDGGTYKLF